MKESLPSVCRRCAERFIATGHDTVLLISNGEEWDALFSCANVEQLEDFAKFKKGGNLPPPLPDVMEWLCVEATDYDPGETQYGTGYGDVLTLPGGWIWEVFHRCPVEEGEGQTEAHE